MISGLRMNTSSAWGAFEQMEEKVMTMEAEAEAAASLVSAALHAVLAYIYKIYILFSFWK